MKSSGGLILLSIHAQMYKYGTTISAIKIGQVLFPGRAGAYIDFKRVSPKLNGNRRSSGGLSWHYDPRLWSASSIATFLALPGDVIGSFYYSILYWRSACTQNDGETLHCSVIPSLHRLFSGRIGLYAHAQDARNMTRHMCANGTMGDAFRVQLQTMTFPLPTSFCFLMAHSFKLTDPLQH
ncbi:hypothetical protein BD410DRAFT_543772 [Rickenella mellea]|uniref:Uncharacterized protein n=1 Tax=Rickenella mellea TaxID=50990 RepID=A0A4Y7PR73_9AGAM|nr:hypothetical protein BD410DRAFT_543772 [Rickenella mellea]